MTWIWSKVAQIWVAPYICTESRDKHEIDESDIILVKRELNDQQP